MRGEVVFVVDCFISWFVIRFTHMQRSDRNEKYSLSNQIKSGINLHQDHTSLVSKRQTEHFPTVMMNKTSPPHNI